MTWQIPHEAYEERRVIACWRSKFFYPPSSERMPAKEMNQPRPSRELRFRELIFSTRGPRV